MPWLLPGPTTEPPVGCWLTNRLLHVACVLEPASWSLHEHGVTHNHLVHVLSHFALRVNLDHELNTAWSVIVSYGSVGPAQEMQRLRSYQVMTDELQLPLIGCGQWQPAA